MEINKKDIQRVQRHMKGCSASLTIREMQIETTMRYHFTPVKMAITKQINKQVLERLWRKRNPTTLLVGMQIGTATGESIKEFPQTLRMELPCNPVIPLL